MGIFFKVGKLINRFEKFIFLSPHLDDAILSCGAFIAKLGKFGKETIIITVFTEAKGKPYTPQAKRFLEGTGYTNTARLFRDRKKEDQKAVESLGGKFVHLGFTDAAWRRSRTGNYIYKSEEEQFSGKIAAEEKTLKEQIYKKLLGFFPKKSKFLLLAPLGIGGHVDHIIVREVAKKLRQPTIFWEDFPYNRDPVAIREFFSANKNFGYLFKFRGREEMEKKKFAIKMYRSQIKPFFPGGIIRLVPESYCLTKDSMTRLNF